MSSEILNKAFLDGDKLDKEQLLDKSFTILDYTIMRNSEYGANYAIVQILIENKVVTFLGNPIILKQLQDIKSNRFPITKTHLRKIGRYWRLGYDR